MNRCTQCGGSAEFLLHTKDYNLNVSDEVFTYYRCTNPECGLVFLFPVPENLSDYYPDNYENYSKPQTLEELENFFSYQEDTKFKQVREFITKGRLLEIGAGYGGFAHRAKKAGFEVDAIEMNSDACRFMNDVIGVKAYPSSDPITTLQELKQYDLIALWQVIEHVPDPWTMLDIIPDHLLPGGIVVISAPNPQSFQFRVFGAHWKPLEAPRHLNLIPAHVIQSRLASKGLHTLVFDSNDELSQLFDYTNWHRAFTRHFENPFVKKVARLASGVTHQFVKPFEMRTFGGTIYTLIFQRPNEG